MSFIVQRTINKRQEQKTFLIVTMPTLTLLTLAFHTLTWFFHRFDGEMPFYINVVREPLQRLVSDYYFLRFHLAGMFPMDKERRARVNSIPSFVTYVCTMWVQGVRGVGVVGEILTVGLCGNTGRERLIRTRLIRSST